MNRRRRSRGRLLVAVVVAAGIVVPTAAASAGPMPAHRCHPRAHVDLRGCDLRGAHLNGRSLAGADLRHADLRGAQVARANFRGAKLVGVKTGRLHGRARNLPRHWRQVRGYFVGPRADLRGARLVRAHLGRADLARADLAAANLAGAVLAHANLTRANLNHAVLARVRADHVSAAHVRAINADFGQARLAQANLRSAQLSLANLGGANLSHADLRGAQLTETAMGKSRLGHARLARIGSGNVHGRPRALPRRWRFTGGYLVGPFASLLGANLSGMHLKHVNLRGADLAGANLRSADLTRADLVHANLTDARAAKAGLQRGRLTGAVIQRATMRRARFAGIHATRLHGRPRSLPAGWKLRSNSLSTVPNHFTAPTNINAGDWIESGNGQFTVNMQSDGNLVEYQGGTAIWATGTSGAVQTVLQTDCNLVIYNAGQVGQPGGAVYTTGTGGGPNYCTFSVADDGSLAVTTSDGTVRWERYANGTIFTHRIQMKQNAPMYSGNTTGTSQIDTIPAGQAPSYVCWTQSQSVGGVDVWFYVLWDGKAGWYPSYYDNSVYSWDARISIDYGIPRCGSVPTTFSPPSDGSTGGTPPPIMSASIWMTFDTNLRPGPSVSSGDPLTVIPRAASPGYYCWTTGDDINGSNVWFRGYWDGHTGYYAAAQDTSSFDDNAQISSKYGIPMCEGTDTSNPGQGKYPGGYAVAHANKGRPGVFIFAMPDPHSQGLGLELGNLDGYSLYLMCWTDGSWYDGNYWTNRWFETDVPETRIPEPGYVHASYIPVDQQPYLPHC